MPRNHRQRSEPGAQKGRAVSLDATPATTSMTKTATTASPFEGLPVLISVPRAAAILGLSRATAYRLATADVLPVRRLGGRVYVVTAKLAAFIDGQQVAA